MRFGTFFFFQAAPGIAHADVVHRELEQMEWTEELGFDQIWLTEHHFIDYGLAVDPASLAASAASRTRRVRIGLAAAILPFHHPLRLAEQMSLIDIISKGRLDVGVGRGNRPAEFRGYHVPQQENRERFDEAVDIMLKAWTEERFSYDGRFFTIGEARVIPKPWQRPHPPIYQVCGSEDGIESSAARGWPMLNSVLTGPIDQLVNRRDSYLTALRKHGPHRGGDCRAHAELGRVPPDLRGEHGRAGARRVEGRGDVVPGLAPALPDPRAHRGRAPEPSARIPRGGGALQEGDLGEARGRDARVRLARHGGPPHPAHAGPRRRPRPVLDELRRPAPGQDPPVDGALRHRSHPPLPLASGRIRAHLLRCAPLGRGPAQR